MTKERDLTIEQMSKANGLLQKLVDGVNKRHEGNGGINAFEAYEIIELTKGQYGADTFKRFFEE